MIPELLNNTASLEGQARQVWSLRNQFRTEARSLMSDRELAKSLDVTDPNLAWQEVLNKYSAPGKSTDQIYQDIIKGSQKSRTSVNNSLGIE